jgi:hypothetical protein
VSNVRRELGDEIEVVELSRRTLVSLLIDGENKWLVVREYGEVPGFHHVPGIPHSLVNS